LTWRNCVQRAFRDISCRRFSLMTLQVVFECNDLIVSKRDLPVWNCVCVCVCVFLHVFTQRNAPCRTEFWIQSGKFM